MAHTKRLVRALEADRQKDIGYEANMAAKPSIEVDARTMINLMSMR